MGSSGGSSEHFLRQLSLNGSDGSSGSTVHGHEEWEYKPRRGSRRWGSKKRAGNDSNGHGGWVRKKEEVVGNKRVMVVIDQSSGAKHAMMWALTHVANKGDFLTLLHVLPHTTHTRGDDASSLANSLGSLCKACKPEVEVEALVIQGPRLATVLSQVKKLEASVLVLSQCKASPFCCLMRSSGEEFVEQCINKADCLTLAVRKQSKGVGGYLISTRWQKNFWLLA